MISTTVSLFICAALWSLQLVDGAAIEIPKYVKFDVEETKIAPSHIASNWTFLDKRSETETTLIDGYTYYMAKVNVGTAAQSVNLLLDTGSSDMWVIDSSTCSTSSCTSGTYAKSKSTTYKAKNKAFSETYGSGKATGTWGTDLVSIGSASIKSYQFAVATSYPNKFGIMGLGLSPDIIGNSVSYANFPKRLKMANLINKVAFSFFAGAHGKNNGHILFGAVDTAKFTGSLVKVPLVNKKTPTLAVSGITLTSSYSGVKTKTLSTASENFLIDTGTSFSVIPTAAYNSLISSLGATKSGSYYFIDCGLISKSITVDFKFKGITIKVPLADLVYQESSTQCLLGVSGSSSGYIFGADAARAAYMVFDYEDYAIYLGAANTSATKSTIKVITTSSVPTS